MTPRDARRTALAAIAGLTPVWVAAFRPEDGKRFLFATSGAALVAGALTVALRRRVPALPIRFRRRDVALGVAVGVAQVGATHAATAIARHILPGVVDEMGKLVGQIEDVPLPLQVALSAGIVGPLEETFWRAGLHDAIDPDGPPLRRVALSTLTFSLFQFTTGHPVLTLAGAFGGSVWALLGEYTGNAGTAIVAHTTWTGLILLVPPIETPRQHDPLHRG